MPVFGPGSLARDEFIGFAFESSGSSSPFHDLGDAVATYLGLNQAPYFGGQDVGWPHYETGGPYQYGQGPMVTPSAPSDSDRHNGSR